MVHGEENIIAWVMGLKARREKRVNFKTWMRPQRLQEERNIEKGKIGDGLYWNLHGGKGASVGGESKEVFKSTEIDWERFCKHNKNTHGYKKERKLGGPMWWKQKEERKESFEVWDNREMGSSLKKGIMPPESEEERKCNSPAVARGSCLIEMLHQN